MCHQIQRLLFVILSFRPTTATFLKARPMGQIKVVGPGHSIWTVSLEACVKYCDASNECDAINYHSATHKCRLFTPCTHVYSTYGSSEYYFYSKRPQILDHGYVFDKDRDTCIKLMETDSDMSQGDKVCTKQNGRLLFLSGPSSTDIAVKLMIKARQRPQFVWAGGGNPWDWKSDFTRSNFNPPQESGGSLDPSQSCSVLEITGHWHKVPCNQGTYMSLCEVPAFYTLFKHDVILPTHHPFYNELSPPTTIALPTVSFPPYDSFTPPTIPQYPYNPFYTPYYNSIPPPVQFPTGNYYPSFIPPPNYPPYGHSLPSLPTFSSGVYPPYSGPYYPFAPKTPDQAPTYGSLFTPTSSYPSYHPSVTVSSYFPPSQYTPPGHQTPPSQNYPPQSPNYPTPPSESHPSPVAPNLPPTYPPATYSTPSPTTTTIPPPTPFLPPSNKPTFSTVPPTYQPPLIPPSTSATFPPYYPTYRPHVYFEVPLSPPKEIPLTPPLYQTPPNTYPQPSFPPLFTKTEEKFFHVRPYFYNYSTPYHPHYPPNRPSYVPSYYRPTQVPCNRPPIPPHYNPDFNCQVTSPPLSVSTFPPAIDPYFPPLLIYQPGYLPPAIPTPHYKGYVSSAAHPTNIPYQPFLDFYDRPPFQGRTFIVKGDQAYEIPTFHQHSKGWERDYNINGRSVDDGHKNYTDKINGMNNRENWRNTSNNKIMPESEQYNDINTTNLQNMSDTQFYFSKNNYDSTNTARDTHVPLGNNDITKHNTTTVINNNSTVTEHVEYTRNSKNPNRVTIEIQRGGIVTKIHPTIPEPEVNNSSVVK